MIELAIDTSSRTFFATLTREGQPVGAHSDDQERDIGSLVKQLLDECNCGWSEIYSLVIGQGPGSFTGLRVGFSYLKGLATTLGLPITPVCSLAASGWQTVAAGKCCISVADAGRGEFFVAVGKPGSGWTAPAIVASDAVVAMTNGDENIEVVVTAPGTSIEVMVSTVVGKSRRTEVGAIGLGLNHLAKDAPKFQGIDQLSQLSPVYLRQVAAKTIAERALASAGPASP